MKVSLRFSGGVDNKAVVVASVNEAIRKFNKKNSVFPYDNIKLEEINVIIDNCCSSGTRINYSWEDNKRINKEIWSEE